MARALSIMWILTVLTVSNLLISSKTFWKRTRIRNSHLLANCTISLVGMTTARPIWKAFWFSNRSGRCALYLYFSVCERETKKWLNQNNQESESTSPPIFPTDAKFFGHWKSKFSMIFFIIILKIKQRNILDKTMSSQIGTDGKRTRESVNYPHFKQFWSPNIFMVSPFLIFKKWKLVFWWGEVKN